MLLTHHGHCAFHGSQPGPRCPACGSALFGTEPDGPQYHRHDVTPIALHPRLAEMSGLAGAGYSDAEIAGELRVFRCYVTGEAVGSILVAAGVR